MKRIPSMNGPTFSCSRGSGDDEIANVGEVVPTAIQLQVAVLLIEVDLDHFSHVLGPSPTPSSDHLAARVAPYRP